MKRIVVTQRVDYHYSGKETRDAVDQNWTQFLSKLGYLPFLVPNTLGVQLLPWLDFVQPHGFILSGGNDLKSSPERDDTEAEVMRYASKARSPLLGVCRGMQLLGLKSGAKLKKVQHHIGVTHKVSGSINKFVNSFHTYSLSCCPNQYRILAVSTDGEIEAIRHKTLPWEGWMWHPERNKQYDVGDVQRFRRLIEMSKV